MPTGPSLVPDLEDVLMEDAASAAPAVRAEDSFAQVPLCYEEGLELIDPTDWQQDAACGPDCHIRVASIAASLVRAGFIWPLEEELEHWSKTPTPLVPPKNFPALQFHLSTLGSWLSHFGPSSDAPEYQAALIKRLGASPLLADFISDFTSRLYDAGLEVTHDPRQPNIQGRREPPPPVFRQPNPRFWSYAPSAASEIFALLATSNVWQVDDVVRTLLPAKDGNRTQVGDGRVQGWLLTRADGHHGRAVILYDACVVVEVLRSVSHKTGDDIMRYCAQSTIRFNEAASPALAPEQAQGGVHYSARRTAALAMRSSHILGYRLPDQTTTGQDFVDYEEARRRLFGNLAILYAAIKAGGIVARIALEHVAPDVVLQGPHADSVELGIGAHIKQVLANHTREYTDDELPPELELFIVGGFFEKVAESPSDFDHVRTFYPRNYVWRTHLPGPSWDFHKEALYQHYRSMNLAAPANGFRPSTNNGWSKRLKRYVTQRRVFAAVNHHAKAFLQSRGQHRYF